MYSAVELVGSGIVAIRSAYVLEVTRGVGGTIAAVDGIDICSIEVVGTDDFALVASVLIVT